MAKQDGVSEPALAPSPLGTALRASVSKSPSTASPTSMDPEKPPPTSDELSNTEHEHGRYGSRCASLSQPPSQLASVGPSQDVGLGPQEIASQRRRPKFHQDHVCIETLHFHDIPSERDRENPALFVIGCDLDRARANDLFEDTRSFRRSVMGQQEPTVVSDIDGASGTSLEGLGDEPDLEVGEAAKAGPRPKHPILFASARRPRPPIYIYNDEMVLRPRGRPPRGDPTVSRQRGKQRYKDPPPPPSEPSLQQIVDGPDLSALPALPPETYSLNSSVLAPSSHVSGETRAELRASKRSEDSLESRGGREARRRGREKWKRQLFDAGKEAVFVL